MNKTERQNKIVEYLQIKPISHGQVNTSQIAIAGLKIAEIPEQRYENLRRSLVKQGSNLLPLIVRRTDAYEEEEYEAVYGADWCLVAKELGIEKLWVWVFDLTDEQATATKVEIEQLLGLSVLAPTTPENYITEHITSRTQRIENIVQHLELSFQEQIGTLTDKVKEIEERTSVEGLQGILHKQLETLRNECSKLEKEQALKRLATTKDTVNNYLESLQQDIIALKKINLAEASKEDIEQVLKDELKAKNQTIDAAWAAINYWKKLGKNLSWENLKKSANAHSKDKIKGFTNKTYENLCSIGYID